MDTTWWLIRGDESRREEKSGGFPRFCHKQPGKLRKAFIFVLSEKMIMKSLINYVDFISSKELYCVLL